MHTAVPVTYGDDYWECRTCGQPTVEPGVPPRHLSEPATALPPVNATIVPAVTTVNGIRAQLAAAPKVGTLRAALIDAIARTPMTDDELEVALNRTHQSVSACRNRLVADGWLEATTLTRRTRTGNDATVWTLTADARANLGVAA